MKPVSCTPKDGYHVVLRCDATLAIESVSCNYIKKVGLVYGEELSETVSVSATISYEITESIFEGFSDTWGISVTTGISL